MAVYKVQQLIQLRELGLSRDKLTIIDPYATLCEQFNDFSHRISMPYLRSPIVHHIHPNPFHLKQFAKVQQYARYIWSIPTSTNRYVYASCSRTVHHYDLNENHIQGYVEALAKKDGQWQIQLNDNQVIHGLRYISKWMYA